MDGVQVIAAFLLLKLPYNLITAQQSGCPTCPEGYFVEKNCSFADGWSQGVRCKRCTNCSTTNQETLAECFMFSDSVCGNKSTVEVPVSAPGVLMVLSGVVLSLVLLMLLSLCLTLMFHRNCQKNLNGGGSAPLLLKVVS